MTRDAVDPSLTNNFDALRLYAAMMVIYGHGFNMTGQVGPGLWGVPFARVGLDVFFSISGYLITASWERTPSLAPFFLKRALRIWPGLIACTVLTAFVLGPLVTELPVGRYLASHYTFRYLANVVFYSRLYLPGVFLHAHYPGAVNGSLWSLFPEALCYISVPLFAVLPGAVRRVVLLAGGLGMGSIGLFMFEGPHPSIAHIYGAEIRYVLVTVPFFFVASFYRLIEPGVADLFRGDVALLCLVANWGFSSWFSWWNVPLEWVTLPYIVITFGRSAMPILRRAARFGDCSYGAYLYAFPIQVLVIQYIPTSLPIPVCAGFAVIAGFLSWHLVERPSIRLSRAWLAAVRPRTGAWANSPGSGEARGQAPRPVVGPAGGSTEPTSSA